MLLDINLRSRASLIQYIFFGKVLESASRILQESFKWTNGEYQVTGSPSQDQTAAKEQAQKATENVQIVDFTDATGKANIDALNNAGSAELTASFAHQLINGMVDGTDCSGLIDTYSRQIGADPASVGKAMEEMFNSQLDNALAYVNQRYGVDQDKFADFIMNKAPNHVKKQALISGFHNDLKGIEYIVKAFKGSHSL